MNIGSALKEIRYNRGLTQVDVCIKLDISQTFLSQIEANKKEPSGKMLRGLCKFYDVPHQVLIFNSMEEKDVKKGKLKAFRTIKKAVTALLNDYIYEK